MIRLATQQDVDALAVLGLRFLEEEYAGAIVGDRAHLQAMAQRLVDAGEMFVAEDDRHVVGMAAFITFEHFLSGEMIASPVCWWVVPEARGTGAGLELWTTGLAQAKGKGATRVQASAPNPKTERIYQELGLSKFETHYQGSLA